MALIEEIQGIHLIGIGGIGVSGVARALMALGYRVTGSDVRASQITEALEADGAEVYIGHSPENVFGAELVVRSTAIPDTNPELVRALEVGIPVAHRAEVLGAILDRHEMSVGVVGTHGKGTTSSALTWILEEAGREPSFIIGALLENFGRINSRLTSRKVIVAEVDESDGSLRHVHPRLVVVNNLEADHLNYYDSLEHIQETVVEALNANEKLERVVLNADDPGAFALRERLNAPVTTFGRTDKAEIRALHPAVGVMQSSFSLARGEEHLTRVEVNLPGSYNADNGLAAAAAALELGVAPDSIAAALDTFDGLENRFTVVPAKGRRVIKDYISHPTGIRRVLSAAKRDGRPITAVFKPYRFTMVNYLQEDYAEAFHDATHTIITELYTAGEVPIPGIDTEFLCDKIRSRGPRVTYVKEMADIIPFLHEQVEERAQVIFFGGDDLFELADRYVRELVNGGGA